LLGLQPKDYDVATSAHPEDVVHVFPRAHAVGAAFGVMLVRRHGITVEVATFREEGTYSDHRRPDDVRFSDARSDAQRRDFTINGLFRDPVTGEVHDFVNGRADLEAGILRAIGDADARLNEDHLRMLRAVRFVATLGVTLEPQTQTAIKRHASQLTGVSRERIGDEIRRTLACPGRVRGAELLESLGLAEAALGSPARPGPWLRLERVGHDGSQLPALMAAWAADRGMEVKHFDALVDTFRDRLLLTNVEQRGMRACLTVHETLRQWRDLAVAPQKRLASIAWFSAGMDLFSVTDPDAAAVVQRDIETLAKTGLSPRRLLDGHDLKQLGLVEGPALGQLLEAVYDAQLEGRVQSRGDAEDLARRLASGC